MKTILPSISRGGGPPEAVEGPFRSEEDPSTSYAGPPPPQMQGRM